MNIAVLALFIAALMPIVLALATIPLRIKNFGEPDLNNPRAQADKFEGLGERLVHAQSNAWEALGLYGASLIAMNAVSADLNSISTPALIFIVARLFHAAFYIANKGILRFLSFLAAAGSVIWIFITALGAI